MCIRDSPDRADNFRGVEFHDPAVRPQQGLALNAVDNEDLGLAVELPIGGKSSAACAHDTGILNPVSYTHLDVYKRQVTDCAVAFCDRIAQAGYQTAVYRNGMLGYLHYDQAQLERYDAWYAEYAPWPSFAYAFDLCQYSNTGTVAGIGGNVDLDLWFPPLEED